MIVVLSYLGNGHFVTNILDETFSEINYGIQLSDQSRTTRGKGKTMCNQAPI